MMREHFRIFRKWFVKQIESFLIAVFYLIIFILLLAVCLWLYFYIFRFLMWAFNYRPVGFTDAVISLFGWSVFFTLVFKLAKFIFKKTK